jgi:hypothetical protein
MGEREREQERGYERREHRKGEGARGQLGDRIWEDAQERTDIRTGYKESEYKKNGRKNTSHRSQCSLLQLPCGSSAPPNTSSICPSLGPYRTARSNGTSFLAASLAKN